MNPLLDMTARSEGEPIRPIRPDRTTFFASFPHPIYGTYSPIKLSNEYPLGEHNTDWEAWDAAKKSMEAWFASRYPSPDGPVKGTFSRTPIEETSQEELDKELAKEIEELQAIEYKEEAEEWMEKAAWRKYNPVLKSMVNAKPNKS